MDDSGPARKGKWLKRLMWLTGIALLALLFKDRLLVEFGGLLIRADDHCRADVMYVLGGAPFERGNAATRLLDQGCTPIAYCTGSNIQQADKAMGRSTTEADLTRMAAIRSGADARRILPFRYGTSTMEEANGVLRHAQQLGVDTILVLSTEFHTRRVGKVFRKRFDGTGITVLIAAAASTEYDPAHWWKSEEGLLMVNNEYVKSLYYALKY